MEVVDSNIARQFNEQNATVHCKECIDEGLELLTTNSILIQNTIRTVTSPQTCDI